MVMCFVIDLVLVHLIILILELKKTTQIEKVEQILQLHIEELLIERMRRCVPLADLMMKIY